MSHTITEIKQTLLKARVMAELLHMKRLTWERSSITQTIRVRKYFRKEWTLPNLVYPLDEAISKMGDCCWCGCEALEVFCMNKAAIYEGATVTADWACAVCYPYAAEHM